MKSEPLSISPAFTPSPTKLHCMLAVARKQSYCEVRIFPLAQVPGTWASALLGILFSPFVSLYFCLYKTKRPVPHRIAEGMNAESLQTSFLW
jgi:hypothetical protein